VKTATRITSPTRVGAVGEGAVLYRLSHRYKGWRVGGWARRCRYVIATTEMTGETDEFITGMRPSDPETYLLAGTASGWPDGWQELRNTRVRGSSHSDALSQIGYEFVQMAPLPWWRRIWRAIKEAGRGK